MPRRQASPQLFIAGSALANQCVCGNRTAMGLFVLISQGSFGLINEHITSTMRIFPREYVLKRVGDAAHVSGNPPAFSADFAAKNLKLLTGVHRTPRHSARRGYSVVSDGVFWLRQAAMARST
jgi:hypothetical protein